ncbi:unnamed protein product [Rotaria socialis]|uniref:Reverse transcriptase domain-containing protein n=1 Tax=Rotaria socialis TaxID=392032 RepID=A0A821BC45_9BILA|nr:unnamed protein product [Rotaria socialis]
MEEKNKNDEVIRRDVSILQNINKITEANIVQHDLKLKRHENILIKFIIPLLDEITKILSYQNYDQQGRVLDPDAKILFELNRAKLKCIIDGENSNGGVMILIKNSIISKEIKCSIPNVCVTEIDNEGSKTRILGVYATESRTWNWNDISPYINENCLMFGDFNIDIKNDGTKAEALLTWADTFLLAPFIPEESTSLRSDRTIDFVFSNNHRVDIQTYKGNTTSDHKPTISIVPLKVKENSNGPHPYTDAPCSIEENDNDTIPEVQTLELIDIVRQRSKKRSCDAHGISNFMFQFLPSLYWSLLKKLYNWSFSTAITPSAWNDVRMLLLAKKDPICTPSLTRPISLLDVFLKINEKAFLTRFQNIINNKGLLPDTQSGFRENFRLQTRVLLFLEQVMSMMANSTPVATIFVDFKTAFDQLWFDGFIGKLKRMGIPTPFLKWIENWLLNRRAYVEIKGQKSRWFSIYRGGPQGSILTPTVFITYHSDMTNYLNMASSFMFADDLAAVVSGRIGEKYNIQCLDLERKLKSVIDALEFYSILSVQPINYEKTVGLWSARAIGTPKFDLYMSEKNIQWTREFKYLGYWITPKLGWNTMINKTKLKIRQRVALIWYPWTPTNSNQYLSGQEWIVEKA